MKFTLEEDPIDMPKNGSWENGRTPSKKASKYEQCGGKTGGPAGAMNLSPTGTTDGPGGTRIKAFHGSVAVKGPKTLASPRGPASPRASR